MGFRDICEAAGFGVVEQIFDKLPMVCLCWDGNFQLVACNARAAALFGLSDKAELREKFYSLMPMLQPGEGARHVPSQDSLMQAVHDAMVEGAGGGRWVFHDIGRNAFVLDISMNSIEQDGQRYIMGYAKEEVYAGASPENIRAAWGENLPVDVTDGEIERIQMLIDRMPMGIDFWDENISVIDCNMELVKRFGLKSKAEYLERYYEFIPEYQPDGRLSVESAVDVINKAFREGYVRCEWVQKHPDGTEIPCDLTMVRLKSGKSVVVAGYSLDLRELKSVIGREHEASELNKLLLDSAPLAISFWGEGTIPVDCNEESLRMFGMKSKAEFFENYHNTFPEKQPDGRNSVEVSNQYLAKALREGYARVDEWMYQQPDGTSIPVELTLIRIKHDDIYVVAEYANDLREIKKTMAKVNEASQLIQTLFDSTPMAAALWDQNMNIINCNAQAPAMFGLKGKHQFMDKYHLLSPTVQPCGSSSLELFSEYMFKVVAEGTISFEWTHQLENGVNIPSEVTLVRIFQGEGYIVASYIRDLREIMNTLEREKEMNERVRMLFNAVPLASNLRDDTMTIVDCNEQACRLFGVQSPQEYMEKYHELSPPKQPCGRNSDEMSMELVEKAFSTGYVRFEWMHQKLDATPMPCEVILVRISHRGSYAVAGYVRDLSEIKETMAKMREADERAKLMLDATPIACFLFKKGEGSKSFDVLDCNMEALNLFGISNKQQGMVNAAKIFPQSQQDGSDTMEKLNDYFDFALAEGYVHFEFLTQRLDGMLIPCEVYFVRLSYQGEYVAACYIHDLREIKAMLAEMHRIEVAEAGNEAKSRFLARMSHEIRTPMNAILGIAEIQLNKDIPTPEIEEAFSKIHASSKTLLKLINDILDLSKIEAGKMELVFVRYEVASLINDTVQLNLMRLGSKKLEFKLHVDGNIPSILIGDEIRIKQILNNLISNAIKYTEKGNVDISFHTEELTQPSVFQRGTNVNRHDFELVENGGSTPDTSLVITIKDTGQGMSREQVASLYDEYARFNESTTNRLVEGTGLGMPIVRNLSQLMNATIDVESEVGFGTTFIVRIPQERASESVMGEELAQNLAKFEVGMSSRVKRAKLVREPMPYGRVLVVDDVETNIYVAKGLIEPYLISVDTAESGFEAIDKIKAGDVYDIIFMDHMMPGLDGIETTKIIRGLGYEEPIVALTANAVIGQAEIFYKNGFSGFVSKPIDIHHLDAYLNKFIRAKQTDDVIESAQSEHKLLGREPGLEELPAKLAQSFLRDANRAIAALEAAVGDINNTDAGQEALRSYIINTHAMKSALANIMRDEPSRIASRLEDAGREGDIKAIKNDTKDFIDVLRQIVEELTPQQSEDAEDEDPAYLREKMQALFEACESYNKKAAKTVLAQLEAKAWSQVTKDLIGKISEHLLHSDFEEAAELAKQAGA